MGTRADFYVGRGESAEWIGSIAWDGYPQGITKPVLSAKTEEEYRANVEAFFATREDVTRPAAGWPWPWEDSCTTDYAYAFDAGKVYAICFGHRWFIATRKEPELRDNEPKHGVFPQFSKERMAPAGSKKSGIMMFGI